MEFLITGCVIVALGRWALHHERHNAYTLNTRERKLHHHGRCPHCGGVMPVRGRCEPCGYEEK